MVRIYELDRLTALELVTQHDGGAARASNWPGLLAPADSRCAGFRL